LRGFVFSACFFSAVVSVFPFFAAALLFAEEADVFVFDFEDFAGTAFTCEAEPAESALLSGLPVPALLAVFSVVSVLLSEESAEPVSDVLPVPLFFKSSCFVTVFSSFAVFSLFSFAEIPLSDVLSRELSATAVLSAVSDFSPPFPAGDSFAGSVLSACADFVSSGCAEGCFSGDEAGSVAAADFVSGVSFFPAGAALSVPAAAETEGVLFILLSGLPEEDSSA
jgi:hypothetical protein